MADRLELGVDADASEVRKVEKALDDVGAAATEAGQDIDHAGQAAADTFDAMQAEIHALEQQVEELEEDLNKAGKAVERFGERGKDVQKFKLRLTEINQGLELVRKGIGFVTSAVNTLADEGNPAFVTLQRSVQGMRAELLDLATDPEIREFITGLADTITTEAVPALKEMGQAAIPVITDIADRFREAQRWIVNSTLEVGAFIGAFDDAAAEELKITKELQEARAAAAREQAEANRITRETAEARKAADDIHARVANDEQLRQLASIENESQLNTLLQEERESLIRLARTGEQSGRTREETLRRIEVIERRLTEIPRQQAEQTRKAAEEQRKAEQQAADVVLEQERDLQRQRVELFAQAERDRTRIAAEQGHERVRLFRVEMEERKKLIEQADGGKLLQNARQALDPRAVARQVGAQRGEQAAAEFTRQNAGAVDASDPAAFRRFQAQRDQAREQAQREGFRAVATGRAGQQEILSAQNELIQANAQNAQAAGLVSAEMVQALRVAANSDMQQTAELQRQATELQQIKQAMVVTGQGLRNVRASAQRGGLGR